MNEMFGGHPSYRHSSAGNDDDATMAVVVRRRGRDDPGIEITAMGVMKKRKKIE